MTTQDEILAARNENIVLQAREIVKLANCNLDQVKRTENAFNCAEIQVNKLLVAMNDPDRPFFL